MCGPRKRYCGPYGAYCTVQMVTLIKQTLNYSPIDFPTSRSSLAGGWSSCSGEQGGKVWRTSVASVRAHGYGEVVSGRIIRTNHRSQNGSMPALPPVEE